MHHRTTIRLMHHLNITKVHFFCLLYKLFGNSLMLIIIIARAYMQNVRETPTYPVSPCWSFRSPGQTLLHICSRVWDEHYGKNHPGLNHLDCTIESLVWWSHSSSLRYAVLRRGTLALWYRRSLYEASAVPKTVRIELSRALLNRWCGGV